MPQISKIPLKKEKQNKIIDLFNDLIIQMNNKRKADEVLQQLLTKTEKVMIAKRLACFYLLAKDVSTTQICGTIKLSKATVNHLRYVLENTPEIEKFLRTRMQSETIKSILKDIFIEVVYGGLRKGSNWSQDKKVYYDHQRRKTEPL